MSEFKAKIAIHSTAMVTGGNTCGAQIFNAEIVHFTCSITNHGLFSASLNKEPLAKVWVDELQSHFECDFELG